MVISAAARTASRSRVETASSEVETAPVRVSKSSDWIEFWVMLFGSFMALADFFVVNVALPSIQSGLRASSASLEGVIAAYGVPYAAGLITGGRLGDKFGRRKVFEFGVIGFAGASAMCAAAPGITYLLAGRVVQGFAAAAMVPQVLAAIRAFSSPRARRMAMGIYGASLGVAMGAGQALGGAVVAANLFNLSWRPAFWLNVPVGVAALVAVRMFVQPKPQGNHQDLDLLGALLLSGATASLVVPLLIAGTSGWSSSLSVLAGTSPLLVAAFVAKEMKQKRRGGDVLIPVELFKQKGFTLGLVVVGLFFQIPGGFFFVMALYLQGSLHYSPLRAGVTTLPFAAGFIAGSLTASSERVKPGKALLLGGMGTMAMGFAILMAAVLDGGNQSGIALLAALATIGLGQGLVSTPLFALIMSNVSKEGAGTGAGVLTTVQQLGFAGGVACVGAAMFAGNASPLRASTVEVGMLRAIEVCLVLVLICMSLIARFPKLKEAMNTSPMRSDLNAPNAEIRPIAYLAPASYKGLIGSQSFVSYHPREMGGLALAELLTATGADAEGPGAAKMAPWMLP